MMLVPFLVPPPAMLRHILLFVTGAMLDLISFHETVEPTGHVAYMYLLVLLRSGMMFQRTRTSKGLIVLPVTVSPFFASATSIVSV